MIRTEILSDGRTHTWSDAGMMIRQVETGNLYEDAVDSVAHNYEETDQLIPDYGEDATPADYEVALARLGVET